MNQTKPLTLDEARAVVKQLQSEGKAGAEIANELMRAGGIIGRKGAPLSEISVMLVAIDRYDRRDRVKREMASKKVITKRDAFEIGKQLMLDGMTNVQACNEICKTYAVVSAHNKIIGKQSLAAILRYGPEGMQKALKNGSPLAPTPTGPRASTVQKSQKSDLRENILAVLNLKIEDAAKLTMIRSLL